MIMIKKSNEIERVLIERMSELQDERKYRSGGDKQDK